MKIKSGIKAALALVALMIGANANANLTTVAEINTQELLMSIHTMSLINWKVGDSQDMKVTLGFGLSGTMHKEATKEEGNAIWVKNELKLPIANDVQEVLYDRDSGKVLKFIHNGKEAEMPNEEIEIVDTKNETIEVPAGKFKVMHVTAKSKSVKQIEIWINPRDISLDGAAKMFMDQGTMKITMELTKFTKN